MEKAAPFLQEIPAQLELKALCGKVLAQFTLWPGSQRLRVGRGPMNELRVVHPGISCCHAEFRARVGKSGHVSVSVRDLSCNGVGIQAPGEKMHRVPKGSEIVVLANSLIAVPFETKCVSFTGARCLKRFVVCVRINAKLPPAASLIAPLPQFSGATVALGASCGCKASSLPLGTDRVPTTHAATILCDRELLSKIHLALGFLPSARLRATTRGFNSQPLCELQHTFAAQRVAVELPWSQNMEIAPDGKTIWNTLVPPHFNFARAACVSIQLAWARECLRPDVPDSVYASQCADTADAYAMGAALCGSAPLRSMYKGSALHDQVLTQIFGVAPDGMRRDRAAPQDLRDYCVTVPEALEYMEILGAEGDEWGHFLSRTCRGLVGGAASLSEALAAVDKHDCVSFPTVYQVVGCGKAFGVARLRRAAVHFDSHQRTVSGEPHCYPTCLAAVGLHAAAPVSHIEPRREESPYKRQQIT